MAAKFGSAKKVKSASIVDVRAPQERLAMRQAIPTAQSPGPNPASRTPSGPATFSYPTNVAVNRPGGFRFNPTSRLDATQVSDQRAAPLQLSPQPRVPAGTLAPRPLPRVPAPGRAGLSRRPRRRGSS